MDKFVEELCNRVKAGEDLDDLEYLRVINTIRNDLEKELKNLSNTNYSNILFKLKVLSMLGKIGGKRTKYLPETVNYFGSTLDTLKQNYTEVINNANIIYYNRSYHNVLNFISQVDELNNYEGLVEDYQDCMTKNLRKGITTFKAPVARKNIVQLENSKQKIKYLSKNIVQ